MSEKIIQLPIFLKILLSMVCLIVFSGCISSNNKYKITEPNNTHTVEKSKETIHKKQNLCNKYEKKIQHAFSYVTSEFEKGYFLKKDIIGAKAQLFLIENNSKSVFAKNINSALTSYDTQLELLKKHNCNLNKKLISPLNNIKIKINNLESNSKNSVME